MRKIMGQWARRWGAGLSVLALLVGTLGCDGTDDGSAAAADDVTSDTPAGMVEACRAARNMLDAHIAADLIVGEARDEGLREAADWAAQDFFALANQVDDAEFAEWAARMRFSSAESRLTAQLHEDPDYREDSDEVSDRVERRREAADEVFERCRDQAAVNIRRDPELVREYIPRWEELEEPLEGDD